MKKFKWLLGMLVLALMPMLQSCDDDGYSIGDFSWDWATVRTTGGGGYYLVGDRWGIIDPVATSIPWFKPVDGERVVSFFNPLGIRQIHHCRYTLVHLHRNTRQMHMQERNITSRSALHRSVSSPSASAHRIFPLR